MVRFGADVAASSAMPQLSWHEQHGKGDGSFAAGTLQADIAPQTMRNSLALLVQGMVLLEAWRAAQVSIRKAYLRHRLCELQHLCFMPRS